MSKSKAERAKGSKSYQKARSQAAEYAKDPEKLNDLIDKASKKAHGKKGPLFAIWGQLSACFRLLRAYAKGTYREIPWSTLVMLVASIIYFVMPIDLIPDFIVGIGHLDDAALLGWTMKAFESDIEAFVEWEEEAAA
ncbi:YkvA family protein [Aeromonas diversa]|uniref:DUF1232 domain-containing protein n=1 Tax=Aeromonas diversa CDC 2478-85 TaxID=1268237 RepID=N9U0K3_9GAMM|nr:YkvA family protein [Aeromonas diversa]ENY71909.1 hypothetical protein G114_10890 [Aeromonas diversa CDC 2478-85]